MRIWLAPVLCLCGCASPSPDMMQGATRQDVTLEGIRFVVFHQDNEAEVIRMGYLGRGQRDAVPGLMHQAAAQASGCEAIPNSLTTKLPGDTGVGRVALDCS